MSRAAASNGIRLAKKALRARVGAAMRELPEEAQKAQSAGVVEWLLDRPEYKASKGVCLFLSMPGELDTRPLLTRALADGKRCFVPRVIKKPRMEFYEVLSVADVEDNFVRSPWGIPEPPTDDGRSELLAAVRAEPGLLGLMVVPGVAFDAAGNRLGHGGGFYDHYFARLQAAEALPPLFAVGFNLQVVDEVPADESDRRVDAVVTAARQIIVRDSKA